MSNGPAIIGTEDADLLLGTELSEEIFGLGGDDIIDGGDGDDEIDGGEGADHLTGGAGDDVYVVDEFDTVVEADDGGDDEVRTSAAAYALADYVERLTGLSGDGQELIGNSLDNIILGGSGGDVLRGGQGNDALTGGDGSDIYHFWRGDGDDRISVAEGSGRDALQFDFDIFESHVTVTQSGFDLILTVGDGGGSVTLLGSGSSFTHISEIIFGDGIVWSREDLLAHSTSTTGEGPDTLTGDDNDNVILGLGGDDVIDGAGGNDTLEGGDGDDILRGGSGNDVIEGGAGGDRLTGDAGNDIYRFARGFGQDVIDDSDSSGGGGYDRIDLLDILATEVTVTAEADTDLIISVNGTSDSIRLENALVGSLALIEQLKFADGTIWSGDDLVLMVSPPPFVGTDDDEVVVGGNLTDRLSGGGGDDSLSGGKGKDQLAGGAGNDLLSGGEGRDTLIGGLGDDVLSGGEGNDFYSYRPGDGNDVIQEHDGPGDGGYDVLDIIGYWSSNTTVGRSSDGFTYILYFGAGEESITLYGAAGGDPNYRIDEIWFEDGAVMDDASLAALALDVGNGDDVLTGITGSTYLRGLGGNDVITGGDLSDSLKGDAGDDMLLGGGGEDRLEGGTGDDELSGGDGDDRLEGGAGADVLAGGTGDDSYHVYDSSDAIVEAAGEGDDVVISTAATYTLSDNVERLVGRLTTGQVLIGNALDNHISAAESSNDILEGGAGNDLLSGGGGEDVYRFARGDGDDIVSDAAMSWGVNAIEFESGILPENVSVRVVGLDMVLTVDGGGGSITLSSAAISNVAEVRFEDGTVWAASELYARSLIGTGGDDMLTGDHRDNVLIGLGGDDILDGGAGNDELRGGDGSDLLAGGLGDDVYLADELDSIVENPGEGEDEVRTSAAVYLLADNVERLTGQSAEGQALTGNAMDNIVVGGSGGDVLKGGLGNDDLAGGAGSDIYFFSRGDGDDTLSVDAGPERDSLQFDSDVFAGEVTVTQSGWDIVLTLDQGGGSVTLLGTGSSFTNLSDVTFGDSSSWGNEELLVRSMITTEGADSIRGDFRDNVLSGLGGGDNLDGGGGNDVVEGGDGDDVLKGGSGDDVVEGGVGDDLLAGGEGHDVYRFQAGFGNDVVANADGSAGGGYDRIEFLGDVLPDDVSVTVDGDDVLISIGGVDQIRVANMLADPAAVIESLAFADGTVTYLPYLIPLEYRSRTGTEADDSLVGTALADSLTGNGGDDTLRGGGGTDDLVGGAGNDLLIGGSDGDLYRWNPGDGNDVIRDEGESGAWDRLYVGGGVERWDTTVGRSADGLSYILYFHGGEESVTLYGAASGDPQYQIEFIQFNMGMWRGITLGAFAQDVGNGDDALTLTGWTYEMRGLGGDDIIHGSLNNDRLRGDSGNDTLIGGEGDDQLEGGEGDDTLTGETGQDRLSGGAGLDVMAGGSGDDFYNVTDAGDLVVESAGQGEDEVTSMVASYVLADNVERLVGLAMEAQVLIGNDLDNRITKYYGDGDTVEGGGGNDFLAAGNGADVYRFARGDGNDVVDEYWWDLNAVEFTTDILPEDVTVALSGSDIILTVDDGGGSITWLNGRNGPGLEVRFADGTVWSYDAVIERSLVGGADVDMMIGNDNDNRLRGMGGDDVLVGGNGNDVLEGGVGNDLLRGGSGDDHYRFERGFGRDEIVDAVPWDGYGHDRIEFMGDILSSEVSVWTTDDGRDLLLTFAGSGDRIVADDAFSDPAQAIEEVVFADGTVWTYADLLAMALPAPALQNEQFGTAGDDILTGGASDDILHGEGGEDVIDGGDGSDELHGGLAADSLSGGAGDDYYFYAAGDGHDVIHESAGHDTIRIGAGLQRGDLTVARSGDGLSYVLFFGAGEASITLAGAAAAASAQIEYIRFANGEGMTGASLAGLAVDVGNGDDIVAVSGDTTALRGLDGNDALYGASGGDWLRGDSGDDVLSGGDGNDELAGGAGSDLLIGGAGDDIYLDVNDASDSVVEADGEGVDEIRTTVAVYALPDHVERLTGESDGLQELTGNALNNIIYGGEGDDILKGGLGNDGLTGGPGSDIFLFSRGDGDDYIGGGSPWDLGSDVLQFGPDILPGDVTVRQASYPYDIVLTLDQGGGSVTLGSWAFSFTDVSQIVFADGTIWSRDEFLAKSMIGTQSGEWRIGDSSDNFLSGLGGDDVIYAGGGNDVVDGGDGSDHLRGESGDDSLDGGAGDDVLVGGEGNDVFRFGAGFGNDVVTDADGSAPGGYDRIQFLGDVLPDEVTVTVDGNDVLISIGGADGIRVANMLADPAAVIEELAFADGTVTYLPYLVPFEYRSRTGTEGDDSLVGTAIGDSLYGNGGDDTLDGGAGADSMIGGAGDDLLIGGAGADSMIGGVGDDLLIGGADGDFYTYNSGEGHDVIRDEGAAGAWDRIRIRGGLELRDTTIGRSEDGLSYILYFHGGEESLTLWGAASGDSRYQIEMIDFYMSTLRGINLAGWAVDIGNGDDVVTGTAGSSNGLRGLGGDDVLTGADYIDYLRGDAGDDTLSGGGEQDYLDGGAGSDALDGGDGDDQLQGGAGADLLAGGAGNDIYHVDDSGDSIVEAAGEGDDEVRSTAAAYALSGDVERLTGQSESGQILVGNALDNTITAGSADDILEGGAGDDTLFGGGGSNTYRFARGDGDDIITDWDSLVDSIEFGAAILPENVRVAVIGWDFVLSVDEEGGSVTFVSAASSPGSLEVRFGDGTVWSYADIVNRSLIGTDEADVLTGNDQDNVLSGRGGDDILAGGYGNDILAGGVGDDELNGGEGMDIYRFARGDGDDVVSEWDYGNAVEFSAGILPGDVRVRVDGPDFILTVNGDGGSVRLVYAAYYAGTVEARFADGTVWTHEDLLDQSLIGSAEAEMLTGYYYRDNVITGHGGDDVLVGSYYGNDILEGGAGSDLLIEDGGNDLYRFERGFGDDVIVEANPWGGGYDRIEFLGDILPSEVTIWTSDGGRDLVISINGTGDRIRYDDAIMYGSLALDEITFADGTVWTAADLLARAIPAPAPDNEYFGTAAGDTLLGGNLGDIIHGAAGDDVIEGGGGSDQLEGGLGDDLLSGGAGNDFYYYQPGDGNDVIRESEGAGYGGYDTLQLGPGFVHDDMTIGWSPDGLSYILYFGTGEESITLYGAASGSSGYGVEVIRFSYGFTMDANYRDLLASDVSNGDDVVTTNAWGWARGLGGNDIIQGAYGWETLKGDAGDDVVSGGDGHDQLYGGAGADLLYGENDNDRLDGGAGADLLSGGAGNDVYLIDELDSIVEYSGEGEDEVRTSAAAYVLGDHLERLTGLSQDGQALTGNDLDNRIVSGSGADVLKGGPGDDYLEGGAGSNLFLYARGDGHDRIEVYRGPGPNTILFDSGILPGDVTVSLSTQGIVLTVDQGAGSVTLLGPPPDYSAVSNVIFGDGTVWSRADLIAMAMVPNQGPNLIFGTWWADVIDGLGGADTIDGLGGNDILSGGDGDDILIGGGSKDLTTGGAGADIFVFRYGDMSSGSWADRIADFTPGEDKIDISALDANYSTWDVNEAYTFIGSAAFSGAPGQVRFFFDGTDTRVQMDVSGHGYMSMEIVLTGNVVLGAGDFIL